MAPVETRAGLDVRTFELGDAAAPTPPGLPAYPGNLTAPVGRGWLAAVRPALPAADVDRYAAAFEESAVDRLGLPRLGHEGLKEIGVDSLPSPPTCLDHRDHRRASPRNDSDTTFQMLYMKHRVLFKLS